MNRFKRIDRSLRRDYLTYAFVIVAYVLLQIFSGTRGFSPTLRGQLVPICAYVVMAMSLNFTVGVLGELSLGHAGFMSVGAFSGAVAAAALQNAIPSPGLRLAIALVIGAVFAGIVGTIISVPVLRLNGDYLAIVTLAFGQIIKSLIENLYVGVDAAGLHFSFLRPNITLAQGGRMILNGPMGIPNISKISTFLAGFILIMITLFIIFNLVRSRAYKMMAFVTSAALAGAAGALFALGQNTIVAAKFDFNTSILILVFVVLGGLGNMFGSIIAAAALTILPEALRGFADYRMLIYAVVLILVMLGTNSPQLKGLLKKLLPGKKGEEV